MYLTEQFSKQDFLSMREGNNYCFFSEPDSGKTSMIVQILQPLAEERNEHILFLYHRRSIGEQVKKKFNKNVTCMTYQALEIQLKKQINLPYYKYIVCDEAHYFVEDSPLNFDTEISFNYINHLNNSIKILLTGTPAPLKYAPWLNDIVIKRDVDHTNHNVESVYLSKSAKAIEKEIFKRVHNGEKTIVFHSSATAAYEMSLFYQEYNSYFICSLCNRSLANPLC